MNLDEESEECGACEVYEALVGLAIVGLTICIETCLVDSLIRRITGKIDVWITVRS